ncbi:MAG: radical SAM protein, partial [Eubacterium sp.]|nr:radical SAM protein [Eubacterium sp.]
DYLAENYPDTYLSLMAQYTPCGDLAQFPELQRKITQREYDKVVNYALSKGIYNIFLQELTSADKNFIPAFDFTGIM